MRIGELAMQAGVSVRALRYYEEQRLLIPERNSAGHRVYAAEARALILRIQELFAAGFCSAVIRELLPALEAAKSDGAQVAAAFAAAQARLESEMQAIQTELSELQRLRERFGLAPDAHGRVQHKKHDISVHSSAPTTSFDHRDRRLR